MIPQLIKVPLNILVKRTARQLLVLRKQFLADREAVLLVDPILSELPLGFPAALTVAPAITGALIQLLALRLQIEAALAIAAAVGVILTQHWVGFENHGVSVQDQLVHELVVGLGEVAHVDVGLWHDEVSHARACFARQLKALNERLLAIRGCFAFE